MKNILSLFICLILFVSGAFSQNHSKKPYSLEFVVVKFKDQYKNSYNSDYNFKKILTDIQAQEINQMFPNAKAPTKELNEYGQKLVDLSGIYQIKISSGDIEKAINQISKSNLVEYAEPLYNLELLNVPNDPLNQTDQYWLTNIKAYEAWDIHQGDTNIIIGISDTGCDLGHEDLMGNLKNNYNDLPNGVDDDLDGFIDNFRGWNFGENNNNVQYDVNAHGVWVSGIAGADTDNGIGVSGAGYKCMILPLKITNADGIIVNAYQSIVYAADFGVDVLNCSWGGTYYQRMAQDVIDYAVINHDMLVVAAAGNTDSKSDYYPASYRNVLSVAGTNPDDERWSPENSPSAQGSSYSYFADLAAPATMFKSTGGGSNYTYMWGGTSFAAPIVSGCAGILRAAFPDYNANQIAELLKISTDVIDTIEFNIPYAGMLGTGRVNLYKALSMEQTPSIVLQNYSQIQSENQISLMLEFVNFLADAENLTININSDSEYANFNQNLIFSGNLATLESYLSENIIQITLDQDTPYDYLLKLIFDYEADNYSGTQVVEIVVNPSFVNINTQKITMSVTANGRIGYSDLNSSIGNGILFDDYQSLMYDFGIISGTSASNILSSVRQSSDFNNLDYPTDLPSPLNSDKQVYLKLDDSNDPSPLNIEIIQNAYSWDDTDKSNFIIVEYSIINKGLEDIDDYYFGLFADWDLINAANNSSFLFDDNHFMYCSNEDVSSMYAGVKLLTNQSVKNYSLAQIDGGDEIVDISDGFADIEKFYMLSNNLASLAKNTDIVQFTGAGPFNIPTNDSITVAFAIIAADNYFDLLNAVSGSIDVYNNALNPGNIQNNDYVECQIYPNPASSNIFVEVPIGETFAIKLTDISGKIIYESNFTQKTSIDISGYRSGLYTIELQSTKTLYKKSFVVIR